MRGAAGIVVAWAVSVALGACRFEQRLDGRYACDTDRDCPSPLVCEDQLCVPRDVDGGTLDGNDPHDDGGVPDGDPYDGTPIDPDAGAPIDGALPIDAAGPPDAPWDAGPAIAHLRNAAAPIAGAPWMLV